jgi:hypothetical protein
MIRIVCLLSFAIELRNGWLVKHLTSERSFQNHAAGGLLLIYVVLFDLYQHIPLFDTGGFCKDRYGKPGMLERDMDAEELIGQKLTVDAILQSTCSVRESGNHIRVNVNMSERSLLCVEKESSAYFEML